jgi:hypothetical protein
MRKNLVIGDANPKFEKTAFFTCPISEKTTVFPSQLRQFA